MTWWCSADRLPAPNRDIHEREGCASMRRRRHGAVLCAVLAVLSGAVAPVPSAVAAPQRLVLSVAAPMPGERVVVSGNVDAAGRQVAVQTDDGAGRSWRTVATVRSGRAGAFSLAWRIPAAAGSLGLRATLDGAVVAGPLRAAVARPRAVLTAPATAAVGEPLALVVRGMPARAGRLVEVQQRVSASDPWQRAAVGVEGEDGRARIVLLDPLETSLLELRAVIRTPAARARSASRTVLLSTQAHAESRSGRPAVLPPAAPGPGAPPLEALAGQDGDWSQIAEQRARWDPCSAIPYRVNLSSVPAAQRAEVDALVEGAVRTLSRDSGLVLVRIGESSWQDPQAGTSRGNDARPADTALTVEVRFDAGAQAYDGYADLRSEGTGADGSAEIVTSDVVVRAPAAAVLEEPLVRNLLLHELGHVAGLGHVQQEDEVMRTFITGDLLTDYQRGDRAGLLALGSPAGCWLPASS